MRISAGIVITSIVDIDFVEKHIDLNVEFIMKWTDELLNIKSGMKDKERHKLFISVFFFIFSYWRLYWRIYPQSGHQIFMFTTWRSLRWRRRLVRIRWTQLSSERKLRDRRELRSAMCSRPALWSSVTRTSNISPFINRPACWSKYPEQARSLLIRLKHIMYISWLCDKINLLILRVGSWSKTIDELVFEPNQAYQSGKMFLF